MRLAAVLGSSRVEFDELVNCHESPGDSCADEWQLIVFNAFQKICLDLA